MKASFLAKEGENYIIKVDRPLMDLITRDSYQSLNSGQDMHLHEYIPNAALHSHNLTEFKKAIATILNIGAKL